MASMFIENEELGLIVREWRFPITFPGSIIDIETTSLEPAQGEIITFGFFSAGTIRTYQRTNKRMEKDFRNIIHEWTRLVPRPYYAYNAKFEEKWLNVKFDYDLFTEWSTFAERRRKCPEHGWILTTSSTDVKCPQCGMKTIARLKFPKLPELISMPHEYYKIEVEAIGPKVPKIWETYLKRRRKTLLFYIIYHNLYDLLREACLLLWDKTVMDLIGDIMKMEREKPRIRIEE